MTELAGQDVVALQVERSYRQLPISLAINLVNGFILLVVLWTAVDAFRLLLWSTLLIVVTVARLLVLRAFEMATRREQFEPDIWRRRFVIGACAAGVVWGAAGVLLFQPDSFPHQVFLAFVLGGMLAGAIPLLSSVDNAYPCFAIPVALPICIQMLSADDRVHLIMGLMIAIFGVAMIASSVQVQRVFRDSDNLRSELSSSIEASQKLERMVRLDPLTQIANRRLFEEELQIEWRRGERENSSLSVITADIDHFKEYNDHYGHPDGDRCLVEVARALENALSRPGDVVARIGGEEFGFLLPRTTGEGARVVAEQLRDCIANLNLPHDGSPTDGKVTLSFGIASSEHALVTTPAHLLRASDMALYEAKRRGRNEIVLSA